MKKIIAFVLVMLLLAGTVACGAEAEQGKTPGTEETGGATTTPSDEERGDGPTVPEQEE